MRTFKYVLMCLTAWLALAAGLTLLAGPAQAALLESARALN